MGRMEEWKTGGFGFRKKTAEQAPQKEVASIQSSTFARFWAKNSLFALGVEVGTRFGSGGAAWTKSQNLTGVPSESTRGTDLSSSKSLGWEVHRSCN